MYVVHLMYSDIDIFRYSNIHIFKNSKYSHILLHIYLDHHVGLSRNQIHHDFRILRRHVSLSHEFIYRRE